MIHVKHRELFEMSQDYVKGLVQVSNCKQLGKLGDRYAVDWQLEQLPLLDRNVTG